MQNIRHVSGFAFFLLKDRPESETVQNPFLSHCWMRVFFLKVYPRTES